MKIAFLTPNGHCYFSGVELHVEQLSHPTQVCKYAAETQTLGVINSLLQHAVMFTLEPLEPQVSGM